MIRKKLKADSKREARGNAACKGGGQTTGKKTHDRPLRGESEIVRGRKSKKSLGENSHQEPQPYRQAWPKVKPVRTQAGGHWIL
jgi:hypothetical protein